MNDELRDALDAVVAEAEADVVRRQSIEAFMETTRTHPHGECIVPYFHAILYPALQADPEFLALAMIGSEALAALDD